MLIELAAVDDAFEILQLQKAAYQSEAALYNDYTISPLHQSLEEMVRDIQKLIVLKAIVDEKIAGSVRGYVQAGTGYVGRLMVLPALQGEGIGTSLLQAIEVSLKGAERFELFTGHKSESNLRLYQKLGYHIFRTEEVNDKLKMVFLEKTAG